jgi:hypothetical protein
MESLNQFLEKDFAHSRELWEKLLKAELKTEDISTKVVKKTLEGPLPILSLSAPKTHLLEVRSAWKKSAQTYIKGPFQIDEDLKNGVRLFFFEKAYLKSQDWMEIEKSLSAFSKKDEVKIFLLGPEKLSVKSSCEIIDEEQMVSGREVHDLGGNNIQELALMTLKLIAKMDELPNVIHVGVFLDSQIFKNIAKIRAAKLLAQKVVETSKVKKEINIVGLTSFREWTLYERYSNMLRNVASVASGYMGGADDVQSSGYQSIIELETDIQESEHTDRSHRMARNTAHILALESMLGVVEDAAFGSYHLENLTEELAKSSWELMQKSSMDELKSMAKAVASDREKRVETRKHIVAGMNDFPDVKEVLNISAIHKRFYRVSHRFEELRLKMEKASKKPSVYVAIFGDYAALNARINFVKNYFELLGLKVIDPGHGITEQELASRKEEIIVLCSSDENYPGLNVKVNGEGKFIAGKFEMNGFQNLFAGQNVYEVLEKIVNKWGRA